MAGEKTWISEDLTADTDADALIYAGADQHTSSSAEMDTRSPRSGNSSSVLTASQYDWTHPVTNAAGNVGRAQRERVKKFGVTPEKWSQGVLCFMIALMSGTYYCFGLYATRIRIKSHFNEVQVQMLGTVMNLGTYMLAPLMGSLHDSIGPQKSLGVCFWTGGTGYFVVSMGINSPPGSWSNSVALMSVGFILVGASGALAYTAAIFTNTTNFSKADRSNAVSAITVGLGLSAPFVAVVYRIGTFGEHHISDYFDVLAILMWTVFGAGWAVLTPHLAVDSERAVAPVKRVAGSDLLLNPIFDPNRPDPGTESNPLSIYDTVGSPDDVVKSANITLGVWHQRWWQVWTEILQQKAFWLVAIPCGIAQGVALWIANTTSTMARTLDEINYTNVSFQLVLIFALSGTVSRLVVASCMNRLGLPHGIYVTVLCGLTAVSQLMYAVRSTMGMLYAMQVLVGIASGGLWTVSITIVRGLWAPTIFGKTFGLFCVVPAVTQLFFNQIGSHLYMQNDNSPEPTDPTKRICYERADSSEVGCYTTACYIAFGCSSVGTIMSVWLIRYTRDRKGDKSGGGVGSSSSSSFSQS